ncbi:MAG: low molecular weight protein-tyrosine-phosphatase [Bacteroidota bacterium]
MQPRIKVLFVCLGNICRSPLAEGVFRHQVQQAGLAHAFEIASAGTGAWHVGEPPDARMRQTAQAHGISLAGQRAQQVNPADLDRYDLVLAMDPTNQRDLQALAARPSSGQAVRLFRDFDPQPGDRAVPDPYYGGPEGFETVYRIVDRTCRALLQHLIDQHQLSVPG